MVQSKMEEGAVVPIDVTGSVGAAAAAAADTAPLQASAFSCAIDRSCCFCFDSMNSDAALLMSTR